MDTLIKILQIYKDIKDLKQIYWVNVFYLVRSDPANGEVLVKQGSMVTVQCTATGNPSPSVTWTRLNQDKVGHIQDKVGYNQDKVGHNQDKGGHN